ncbi:hypothetical protein KCP75_15020 [Salmonella enterica subsp. enterica]|nr:hypothetical protein KCP75_15020 [Salmonella enterica subsp. enterica]
MANCGNTPCCTKQLRTCAGGWLTAGTHCAEPYRTPVAEPRCRALSHRTCVIGVGGILGISAVLNPDGENR